MMRIRGCWPLVIVLLLASLPAMAQYEDEEGDGVKSQFGYTRGMELGFGGVYQSFQDEGVSPLLYTGTGYSPLVNFTKNKAGRYAEVRIQGSFSNFKNQEFKDREEKVKSRRAVIDYRQMMRFTAIQNERWQTFAGGMLSGQFAYKNAPQLAGSASVYEYAVSLGVAGRLTKKMATKDRDGLFAFDIALPFLANVARPIHLNRTGVLEQEKLKFGDIIGATQTGFINTFMRINSRVSYTYPINNGNAVVFGYSWDYYRIKHTTSDKFAEHTLFLSLMFNY